MDRRNKYTQTVIKEALFTLLENKSLSQITVKEICQIADINRTTFYRNYTDIYDLYEKLEKELVSKTFSNDDIVNDRYKLLELIYENQSFYKEFFNSRLESKFITDTVKNMYNQMKQLLISRGSFDERTFEISYQYNYYGVIGVLKEWLNAGCPEQPKAFGDILYSIVEKQYS